jgi:hypothetical protein
MGMTATILLKKKEKEIIKEVEEKRGSKEERDSVL